MYCIKQAFKRIAARLRRRPPPPPQSLDLVEILIMLLKRSVVLQTAVRDLYLCTPAPSSSAGLAHCREFGHLVRALEGLRGDVYRLEKGRGGALGLVDVAEDNLWVVGRYLVELRGGGEEEEGLGC